MRPYSVVLRAFFAAALAVSATIVGIAVAAVPASAATHDTTVYAFGSASFHGSTEGRALGSPVAGLGNTANGQGYWIVLQDGSVYSFNAPYYGGINGFPLAHPVVGITATPSGHGYWIVTDDGTVFKGGDAQWYGGATHDHLNAKIKALIAAPDGHGYWLYASDGGVFGYGSAKFYGSTGGMHLNKPVVSMAASKSGHGYWLVASDGGIFGYGDAKFHGSAANLHLTAPIVGMARTGTGKGYWLAGADGGVFGYGDAPFRGSAHGIVPGGKAIVQLAGMPDGNGYRMLALNRAPDIALQGYGARGPQTAALQYRLLAYGYWLPGINSVFDADTQQAVWAFQKANGLSRTGVVDSATQARLRSISRPVPRSRNGYVIEIDKTRQIIMVVQNGFVNWTFNTSTGSEQVYWEGGSSHIAHTPEGIFSIVSQIDGADNAPLGLLWRPKFFTWEGHAIHGSGSIPPYPASHGCARVSNNAINWMWANNILPLGTTVWVYH